MQSVRQTMVGLLFTGMASIAPLGSAHAQDISALANLERRIKLQDEEIARMHRLIEEQGALLRQLAGEAPSDGKAVSTPDVQPPVVPAPARAPNIAYVNSARPAIASLKVSGDFRIREEYNYEQQAVRDRARTAIRARLRAQYELTPHLALGAGVVTGDPDDPNSTDITLSSFDDDLDIALDQAWLRYTNGGLTLHGGKVPNPFLRTDMVWDGDVNPQGISVAYRLPAYGSVIDARGLYFIVDESASGADSEMLGGQAILQVPINPTWKLSLAGGYYHYRLSSLNGADPGDFRTNLISNGRYLSKFRILDVIGTLSYSGFGERWPVSITANFARNLGAEVPADSGFYIEASLGRAAIPGDWRVSYNRSEVEVDAVFAAFSHDNIALATNYSLHGLTFDYLLWPRVFLNATLYHYRPLEALYSDTIAANDWRDRIRISMMVDF